MKDPRNPFRLRSSEGIESDDMFVRLFSPDVLKVLSAADCFTKPLIIRSAPGGGKTTLLRLFSPRSLLTVQSMRENEHCKLLYSELGKIGAVREEGPAVLGVLVRISKDLACLDDLNVSDAQKLRLFRALLNARVTLNLLHSTLALRRLRYPDDLSRLTIDTNDRVPTTTLPGLTVPCSGEALYSWAQTVEHNVGEAIDSFQPIDEVAAYGHDSLLLSLLSGSVRVKVDNIVASERLLFMFDNVDDLTSRQRRYLLDDVISSRYASGVWIAERLRALEPDQLLSEGAHEGRDVNYVHLEDEWRKASDRTFEKLVGDIADRRVQISVRGEFDSFASCLQDSVDGVEWNEHWARAASELEQSVRNRAEGVKRYSDWIDARGQEDQSHHQAALAWKALDILISREERKVQRTLDFTLPEDQLDEKDDSQVRAAAELFVHKDFGVPYYYGATMLARASSSNIEQFLSLAGEIYERSISAALLRQPRALSPLEQDRLLRRVAVRELDDLVRRVDSGGQVQRFIESIGKMSRLETYRPNAPYAPGVTGIGIDMRDREKIVAAHSNDSDVRLRRLAIVLGICIANNLLEVKMDQKCKGKNWMVLYLNRMLCIRYELPLKYGGWREQRLPVLTSWVHEGFKVQKDLYESK
jgi:hypothetical protein